MESWLTSLVFALFGASLGASNGTEAFLRERTSERYTRIKPPRLHLFALVLGMCTIIGLSALTENSSLLLWISLPLSIAVIARTKGWEPPFQPDFFSISTIVLASLSWLIHFSQGDPQ